MLLCLKYHLYPSLLITPCSRTPRAIRTQFRGTHTHTAFETAVLTMKSLLLAHALQAGRITVEQAEVAARLEVRHQITRWGEVEDAHDVDAAEMQRKLGACCAAWITMDV